MANSLFTAVTGLRINQEMLDVVGNNLANSNTTGFKSQRVLFADLVYQTIAQATTASSSSMGGTNPIQIGLGAKVSANDSNLQQGSLEATGRDLDLAIQGNGYFVARNGTENFFTRAGAFGVDSENYLVDPSNGYRVQRFGTIGEGSATSPNFQAADNTDISIPIGTGIPGKATTSIVLHGNVSANAIGPQAQRLVTAQSFRTGGVAATGATLLNALDGNFADYAVGDSLQIQGVNAANLPVSFSLAVGAATTLNDVINAINSNFVGSVASLDASGNMVIQADTTGPTSLSVSINDAAGNAGATSWGNHSFAITTLGKDGDTIRTGIQVFDSQGAAHNLELVFQKSGNNTWDLNAHVNANEGTILDNLASNIIFNEDGSFRHVTGTGLGNPTISVQFNGFSTPQVIGFNFGTNNDFDGLSQVGGASSAVATGQDGFAAGFLSGLSIGADGVINGIFTNGRTIPVAQMAIASFANPGALNRIGDNYYSLSSESGPALIGGGLSGGRGAIQQKSLESSNVDVSLEFTRLIIAQRGFQVNARVITASDQILQELANILR